MHTAAAHGDAAESNFKPAAHVRMKNLSEHLTPTTASFEPLDLTWQLMQNLSSLMRAELPGNKVDTTPTTCQTPAPGRGQGC